MILKNKKRNLRKQNKPKLYDKNILDFKNNDENWNNKMLFSGVSV